MRVEYEFQHFDSGRWVASAAEITSREGGLAHLRFMAEQFPRGGFRLVERQISEFVIGLDGLAARREASPPLDTGGEGC